MRINQRVASYHAPRDSQCDTFVWRFHRRVHFKMLHALISLKRLWHVPCHMFKRKLMNAASGAPCPRGSAAAHGGGAPDAAGESGAARREDTPRPARSFHAVDSLAASFCVWAHHVGPMFGRCHATRIALARCNPHCFTKARGSCSRHFVADETTAECSPLSSVLLRCVLRTGDAEGSHDRVVRPARPAAPHHAGLDVGRRAAVLADRCRQNGRVAGHRSEVIFTNIRKVSAYVVCKPCNVR